MNDTIAMIGAGNMAQALIGGLLRKGYPATALVAADPSPAVREQVNTQFGVRVEANNADAIERANVIVLALKPQMMDQVITGFQAAVAVDALIISVAAGITVNRLEAAFQPGQAIVRVMPNTPALLGLGASGVFANRHCDQEQRNRARFIFEAVGKVAMIEDEQLMDAVTAVSGSGPAYFFALAEALTEAGIAAGLPASTASLLAQQTAAGAGAMLAQDHADAASLRKQVTSPGGTTAAALDSFERQGFKRLVANAVQAAVDRGKALGQTPSGEGS